MAENELQEKAFEVIEIAKRSGKIKKGSNEVTKAVEKGIAKLAVVAGDVNPAEIVMHIEPLCKEKSVPFIKVSSKDELGTAAGLPVSTTAVAVINEGDAKAQLEKLVKELNATE
ncbi:50S ribosomal protein L7ae [Candidatus Woesearchaeota archaeon]|nr:MAG: 50S ribosomal protein L7ae [Candidatus Woesearchaeota archaeon]